MTLPRVLPEAHFPSAQPLPLQGLPAPLATPPAGDGQINPAAIQAIADASSRAAPDILNTILYPPSGNYAIFGPGLTEFDLDALSVVAPNFRDALNGDKDTAQTIQSALLTVDSYVSAEILPGFGRFPLFATTALHANARNFKKLRFYSDTPFKAIVAFSTGLQAPVIVPLTFAQDRYSDTTLVKGTGANIADAFTSAQALRFVARLDAANGPVLMDGGGVTPSTLTEAQNLAKYGVPFLRTFGLSQKMFIIRNLGPSSIDVLGYGTFYQTTAVGLTGTAYDGISWVADTDMTKGTGGVAMTLASGAAGILETGLHWGLMQLRARVNAGAALGATARIIVESIANAPQVR